MGDFDRQMRSTRRGVSFIFVLAALLIVAQVAAAAWLITWVVQNPEAIGDWFRRLFGGGA